MGDRDVPDDVMETSLTIAYDKQWLNCVSAIGPIHSPTHHPHPPYETKISLLCTRRVKVKEHVSLYLNYRKVKHLSLVKVKCINCQVFFFCWDELNALA